jgi:hypothetical protein
MKKTVVIDEDVHKKLKNYCEENNLKINNFINQILSDYNMMIEHDNKLPNFLRNEKGSIVEMTVCSFVSNEYKKHLPKEISLMRKVGDEGYVASYIQK